MDTVLKFTISIVDMKVKEEYAEPPVLTTHKPFLITIFTWYNETRQLHVSNKRLDMH